MPIYCWRCDACGRGREVVRAIAECMSPEFCDCGVPMQREITAAHVRPDIAPYKAVTGDKAGQYITSRKEHREFLKRNRLIEVGTDPPKDTSQFRKTIGRGEIRNELKRVVPDVLRKHRRRA
jgi:hypothetical protein